MTKHISFFCLLFGLLISCQSGVEQNKASIDSELIKTHTPVVNFKYPVFKILNVNAFLPKETETFGSKKNDSLLQQNFKGLGRFHINSDFDLVKSELIEKGVPYNHLNTMNCAKYFFTIAVENIIEPAHSLVKGISFESINIAGVQIRDLGLIFYDNKLERIAFEYETKVDEFSKDKYVKTIDELKQLLVTKYGQPLAYNKMDNPTINFFGNYKEHYWVCWKNIRDNINIELTEEYQSDGNTEFKVIPETYRFVFIIEKKDAKAHNYLRKIMQRYNQKGEKEKQRRLDSFNKEQQRRKDSLFNEL